MYLPEKPVVALPLSKWFEGTGWIFMPKNVCVAHRDSMARIAAKYHNKGNESLAASFEKESKDWDFLSKQAPAKRRKGTDL